MAQAGVDASARAIGANEFAGLMARLGPFEPAPHLAVAVSGGVDSMALALLSDRWARSQGGHVTALIVDHGLRPESTDEARQVGQWLGQRGIAASILTWAGPKPRSSIQAAARDARYQLLSQWCARAAVLHLLVGHHRDDQVETVLMRQARGSGTIGLAGMAQIVERPDLRLLRPLLAQLRARLVATAIAFAQSWVDDPSNADRKYARIRLRQDLAVRGAAAADDAVTASRQAAAARAALERAACAVMARACAAFPAGYVRLDMAVVAAADELIARRVVERCLLAVGGRPHGPRRERFGRVFRAVTAMAKGRRMPALTLAGCRVQRWPGGGRAGAHIMICREVGAVAPPVTLRPGESLTWDSRFAVVLSALAPNARWQVGALGRAGWAAQTRRNPALRQHPVLPPVRPTLPALWNEGLDVVLEVPHLIDSAQACAGQAGFLSVAYCPAQGLGPGEFFVA